MLDLLGQLARVDARDRAILGGEVLVAAARQQDQRVTLIGNGHQQRARWLDTFLGLAAANDPGDARRGHGRHGRGDLVAACPGRRPRRAAHRHRRRLPSRARRAADPHGIVRDGGSVAEGPPRIRPTSVHRREPGWNVGFDRVAHRVPATGCCTAAGAASVPSRAGPAAHRPDQEPDGSHADEHVTDREDVREWDRSRQDRRRHRGTGAACRARSAPSWCSPPWAASRRR